MIPKMYGVAWFSYTSFTVVCYPIPLNWVLGGLRKSWFLIAQGPRWKHEQEIWNVAYEHGFKAGKVSSEAKAAEDLIMKLVKGSAQ